jgi:hypothetical protein
MTNDARRGTLNGAWTNDQIDTLLTVLARYVARRKRRREKEPDLPVEEPAG